LAYRTLRTKGGFASAVADTPDKVSRKPPSNLLCVVGVRYFQNWDEFAFKNNVSATDLVKGGPNLFTRAV